MTREQQLEEILSKIVNRSTRVKGEFSNGVPFVQVSLPLMEEARDLIQSKREF